MTDAEYEYLFRDADPRWKAYYRTQREEYRKKHPRTNFEKWRDSLTAEWVAEFMERYSIHCGCYECPANWYHGHGEAQGRHGCRGVFLEWANAPAKEEK